MLDPLGRFADELYGGSSATSPSVFVARQAHRLGFKRGWTWCLLSVLGAYLVVTLLAGCASGTPVLEDTGAYDGEVACSAEFALAGTTDVNGVYRAGELCYEDLGGGERDLSGCCPAGWTALGLTPDGNGVVCAP